MTDRIWISSEMHRRSETLSKLIGAKLFQLEANHNPQLRYPLLLMKAMKIAIRENPKYIFVQNPSVVLAFFVAIFGRILGRKVIVDAHNIGIFFEHPRGLIRCFGQVLNNLIIRICKATIVTNPNLAKVVRQKSGCPFVLPDPFPIFREGHQQVKFKSKNTVFYICSFSSDEPYLEVFKAARYLDENTLIYVSGNHNGKVSAASLPPTIVLTGYLPENEYINYLYSSDVIIDLTLCEHLLVCGAYEAFTAEKPLILSNTSALKNYFGDGALYTDNRAIDIAHKIDHALRNAPVLKSRVKRIREVRAKEWERLRQDFEDFLRNL